jgi:hypothetical protein
MKRQVHITPLSQISARRIYPDVELCAEKFELSLTDRLVAVSLW